jgi:hypothetical protein
MTIPDEDLYFFVLVVVACMLVWFLSGCAPSTPAPCNPCQESVEPIGFGFGARCQPGAVMSYHNTIEAGLLEYSTDPWAGGYILCHCVTHP